MKLQGVGTGPFWHSVVREEVGTENPALEGMLTVLLVPEKKAIEPLPLPIAFSEAGSKVEKSVLIRGSKKALACLRNLVAM